VAEQPQFPIPLASDEDIAAFVARYGTPYDSETDDYDREPFVADIREGKNDPIYNAHSYHTKVPPRAIIPYILHYTNPGDVILDPFCGSGMTGVAGLMCHNPPYDIVQSVPGARRGARAAILNDLSPAACHIAYNYCNPVHPRALLEAFEVLRSEILSELSWLYETTHFEPASGLYDPRDPDVARRLGDGSRAADLFGDDDASRSTWSLLDRSEVEKHIGKWSLERAPLPPGANSFIAIPATIQQTLWSDVYKCEGMVSAEDATARINRRTGKPATRRVRRPRGCGAEIVLWDSAVDHDSGRVSEVFRCPECGQEWKKTQLKRLSVIPVLTFCKFSGLKPQKKNQPKPRPLTPIRANRPTTDFERARLREIEARRTPWQFPDEMINTKGPQYNRNALSARKVTNLPDFYTHRNLWALSSIWTRAWRLDPKVRNALLFAITASFGRIERMTNYKFGKGGNCCLKGQLYFPSLSVEDNVLRELESKVKHVAAFMEAASSFCQFSARPAIRCGDAGQLGGVEDNSIDYVFCDPPFGSNIYYSEVNWLYECWLGRKTEVRTEAVVHRKNDRGTKTIEDYSRLMAEAFGELFRVLKPGRYATVEFNNSDGEVFEAIKRAARDAGFSVENMVFLDKVQKTFKQIKGEKGEEDVVGHDVIFNLRKPSSVRAGLPLASASHNGEPQSLDDLAAQTIREHLRTLPHRIQHDPTTYSGEHRTTPFLNTMLMNALIPRGVVDVSQINLPYIERLCGRYFRKVDGRWYLRDEAVRDQRPPAEQGVLFRAPEDELAIIDETSAIEWLRHKLLKTPMRVGELRPHWMRATVKLAGDTSTRLDQYLQDHFWLDRETHRWREPTREERATMDIVERRQARHDAERFLAGHLARHPADDEVLDWIEHLYRWASLAEEEAAGLRESHAADGLPADAVELYSMMQKLFQGVLKEKVDANRYALAQRQCRIARAKLAARAEAEEQRQWAPGETEESPS
jgi:16S rRNA G966 N2-methylase RsmD